MTWSKTPEIHVLATAVIDATPSAGTHKGEVVPQMWTYEKQLAPAPSGAPYRAFVWMQGHNYANFALPNVQQMLLRAIAWTGKRPIDALMTERPQRRQKTEDRR
jgi:type 1 glutamine amidotransferase